MSVKMTLTVTADPKQLEQFAFRAPGSTAAPAFRNAP